jgi:riboflavin synthase
VFTGIVRERGRVASFEDGRVAVDGVCLTVVGAEDGRLAFDVVAETRSRAKRFGDEVNVEPALRAGEPMGGHVVQGHVDGTGTVRSVDDGLVWIDVPADVLRYCVEKGSIAVDGVSLTVAALDQAGIAVALVPHTLSETTLGGLAPRDDVNLEADILAKYVERLIR